MLVVPPSSGTLRVIVSLVWLLAIHESAASSNSTVSDTKWSDLNGVSRENTYGIDILWRAPTSLEGFVASPSLVDVQGDGKVDIVIPCVAQCIEVVDGVSGRDFTSQWPFVSSHWRGALPAFTLDMDRDGWEDIFVVSMYGDMVVLDRFGTPIVNATWTLPTMYIAGEKEGPSIRSDITQSAATRWQTLSTDSETHGNEKALHNERLSASENDVDEEDEDWEGEDWEDEADAAPDPPSSNSSPPQYSMEALRSFSMLHAKHSKLCGMKDECTDDNDSFILERNSPFQSHHIERLYKDALIHFREQLSAEELQRLFTVDATAESLQDALHPHIYHNPAYTCVMMDSSNECSPLAVLSVVYFFDASLYVDTNIDLPSEESPNEKTQSKDDELHGNPNETDGENSSTQQEKVVPRTPNLFVHALVGVSLQSSMKVQWTTELHRWSETFASDRELHLSFTREFVSGSRKGPVIVDIDHDGEHEIVLAGQKNRRAVLWVLSMDGSVKCSTEAGITCQPPQWPQDVATDIPMDTSISTLVSTHLVVDDLDGDGLLDLCFGLTIQRQNDPSSQVEVRCYNMTPAFGAPMWRTPLVKSAGTISASSLTLTDLDGDGDLDLVFGTSNGFIYALKGATGALLWPDQYPHALGEGMLENGSQSIGIVSPITVVPLKAVYRSEGTDKQADASILTLIFTTTTGALVVADATTPKEPKRTQHFLLGEVSIASVVIGDVNHDGYLDLVVATLSGGLYLLSTNTPAAHMLSQPMALPRPFTNSVARVFPSDCMRGTMEQDGRVGAAAYLMLDPASIAYRDVMGEFFLLRWTIVDERRAVRMQQVSPAYRIVVRFGGVIHSNTSAAHTYGVDEKLSSAGSSTLYVGHYMTAGPHTEKIAAPRFSACGTVSVTLTLENSLSTVQTFSMSFNRNYRDLVRWLFLIPLVLFMAAISHVRIEDEVVLGDTHDEADDATFSDEDEDEELLALDRANGVALLYSTRGIRVIRV